MLQLAADSTANATPKLGLPELLCCIANLDEVEHLLEAGSAAMAAALASSDLGAVLAGNADASNNSTGSSASVITTITAARAGAERGQIEPILAKVPEAADSASTTPQVRQQQQLVAAEEAAHSSVAGSAFAVDSQEGRTGNCSQKSCCCRAS